MLALEWQDVANADLLSIVRCISDDNAYASQRLEDKSEAKATKLLEQPRPYRPGHVRGTREMVVRSNYAVMDAEHVRAMTSLQALHAA